VVYETYTKLLNNIDFGLATAVATQVGGDIPKGPARENKGWKSAPLSQLYYAPKTPTIKSRRIAILVSDGFNFTEVEGIRAALKSAMATTLIIGPRRAKIQASSGGAYLMADHHFDDQRSTMFDGIIIPSGEKSALTMVKSGKVIHWVREAFGHCKAIGAVGEGAASRIFLCRS